MMKKASWFVCFLVLAISCLDEPDCFRLNNNLVGVSFKKMLGGAADTVALVGVQASGTDSIFNQFIITSGVYLPLNYFNTQTSFALQGLEDLNQLVFGYEVKAQFVSDECGARYVLSNLSLISHDFDSVRFTSSTPSASEGGSNIEIYRCPRTNLLKLAFRQLQNEASVASPLKIASVIDDYSGVMRYVDTTLQIIYLPVNPEANSSQFILTFSDRIDSLKVDYTKYPRKFFDVCGDQLLFGGLKVSVNNFDSLLIVKDSIQDPPITNVTMYRCPQTNLVRVYFRQVIAPVRPDTISVIKVTDDSGNTLYDTGDLMTAILPLNEEADSTEFTFELLGGSTKKLTLQYGRTQEVLFNACGPQTIFTLSADPPLTDFQSAQVTSQDVVFPVKTNVEVIP